MSDAILRIFEGLTEDEVRELRKAITPALQELKEKIIQSNRQNKDTQTMNINQKLNQFEQRKQGIYQNKDLTYAGQRKQLDALEKEMQGFKAQAYGELSAAWKTARDTFAGLSRRKAEAEEKSASQWDFNRLSYYARAIEAEVQKAQRLEDVRRKYDEVLRSGDKHLRRAWAENGYSEITKRWRESLETTDIKRKASNDLASLTASQELDAINEQVDKLTKEVLSLHNETETAARHFSDGVFSSGNVFSDLLNGVQVSQRMDAERGVIISSVNIE